MYICNYVDYVYIIRILCKSILLKNLFISIEKMVVLKIYLLREKKIKLNTDHNKTNCFGLYRYIILCCSSESFTA